MKVRFIIDDMATAAPWMGFGRSQAAKMAANGVQRRHFPLGDVTVDIRVFDRANAQVRISGSLSRGFVFGLELEIPAGKGGGTIRTPVRRLKYGSYAYEDLDPDVWRVGVTNRTWQNDAVAYAVVRPVAGGAAHLRNGVLKKAATGVVHGETYVESAGETAFLADAYEVHPLGTRVWKGQKEYTVDYTSPGAAVFLRDAPVVAGGGSSSTTTQKGTLTLPDVFGVVGGEVSLGSLSTSTDRSELTSWIAFQYGTAGADAPIVKYVMTDISSTTDVTVSYAGPYVLDTPPPNFITTVVAEGQQAVTESTTTTSWDTRVTLPWSTVPMLSSSGAYQTRTRLVEARYHPELNSNTAETGAMVSRSDGVSVIFYDARAQTCVWSYVEESRGAYTTSAPASTYRTVCYRDVRGTRELLWERSDEASSSGVGAAVTSGGVAEYVAIYASPDGVSGAPIFDGNPAFRAAVLKELADNTTGTVKADMQAGALDGYLLRPYYNVGDVMSPLPTGGILVT